MRFVMDATPEQDSPSAEAARSDDQDPWFGPGANAAELAAAGFRLGGSGVHQSKTMLLADLARVMEAGAGSADEVRKRVLRENILGKKTESTRAITLERLRQLYPFGSQRVVWLVLAALWPRDPAGRPLLALLSALARDALLRESADAVLPAPLGAPVRWPDLARIFTGRHPRRFRETTLSSLAQHCAATWTQAGHLHGRVNKVRARAHPTPATAAYAAFLAGLAGFGGPALLASPWLAVLDRGPEERFSLLRQAESLGLARLRVAGDVTEIFVRRPMAETLGISLLADA